MNNLKQLLEKAKELAGRATPGPWISGEDGAGTRCIFWKSPWHGKEDFLKIFWPGHPPEATKQIEDWWEGSEEFIAASRAIVPMLVEICERQQNCIEWIAGGCLVPPDGGTTKFEDAIDEAGKTVDDCDAIAKKWSEK